MFWYEGEVPRNNREILGCFMEVDGTNFFLIGVFQALASWTDIHQYSLVLQPLSSTISSSSVTCICLSSSKTPSIIPIAPHLPAFRSANSRDLFFIFKNSLDSEYRLAHTPLSLTTISGYFYNLAPLFLPLTIQQFTATLPRIEQCLLRVETPCVIIDCSESCLIDII
jgi:hypothetical protein